MWLLLRRLLLSSKVYITLRAKGVFDGAFYKKLPLTIRLGEALS
jgi:hypothetical protein